MFISLNMYFDQKNKINESLVKHRNKSVRPHIPEIPPARLSGWHRFVSVWLGAFYSLSDKNLSHSQKKREKYEKYDENNILQSSDVSVGG